MDKNKIIMQRIAISDMLPAANHTRTDLQPSDLAYEQLLRSIDEFGYIDPIIWNKRTGNIVGGHQRFKVLKHLGETEVDCVVIDEDEVRESVINITLNKVTGSWCIPKLATAFTTIEGAGFNLDVTGWSLKERDGVYQEAHRTKDEIQTAVDAAKAAGFEVAEIDGEPVSKVEKDGEDSHETAVEIEPQAEVGDSPEGEDNGEISEDSEDGIFTISYPLGGFTSVMLDNLEKMVNSKAPLIKKAIGADSLPIEIDGEEVKFPWFAKCEHSDMMAYAQFIERICKTAQAKQRVTATAPESFDNEKFSMRVWLISLGCKGEEFAFLRKRLMRDLSGNSGFRYEDKQPRNPRSGGVSEPKQVVSVRFTAEMLDKLAELASQSNMSRNQLIESVVCEYVQTELPETEVADESPETETE